MERLSKSQLHFTSLAILGMLLSSCSRDQSAIVEINEAPIISAQSFAVDENSSIGYSVGMVVAEDPNDDDLAFSITGNSQDIFVINQTSGELIIINNRELDFEIQSSVNVMVQVSDGELTNEAQVTVNINNIAEFEDNSTENCSNTAVFDPNFTGTACCTQRISDLSAGNTLQYEYSTNLPDPKVEWQVNSGDLEIIEGANANVVTIRLGDTFTEGKIFVLGTGTDEFEDRCGHPISISLK